MVKFSEFTLEMQKKGVVTALKKQEEMCRAAGLSVGPDGELTTRPRSRRRMRLVRTARVGRPRKVLCREPENALEKMRSMMMVRMSDGLYEKVSKHAADQGFAPATWARLVMARAVREGW
jgi:hypothetical protein